MPMLFGGLMQQAIRAVAKLCIPDLLAERSQTAAELAAGTATHAPSLYRVLRTLASAGVFAETPDHRFELTPVAELLRTDVPNSMRDFAIMQGEEWNWRGVGELMHSVRCGGTAHAKVHGMELFEYLSRQPEDGQLFDRAMTSYSLSAAPALVEAYDFSCAGTIADIGGGHGILLAAMLKANPQARGILFDLPSVIDGAGDLLQLEGVQQRVSLVAGDFFQSVPAGADIYTMKNVLHDWDDERSVAILRNVHSAMGHRGKVLVVELVVAEGNEPGPAKLVDLQMLVTTGGRERTAAEFGKLLEESSFRLTGVVPTNSPMSIIEADPA
jgi:hypothetical protein